MEGGGEKAHEGHRGDGHELFMNVSMKGSKKEEGRAREEMAAAAAAADFASLQGALLPKPAASAAAAPALSARPSCLFHFTKHRNNSTHLPT